MCDFNIQYQERPQGKIPTEHIDLATLKSKEHIVFSFEAVDVIGKHSKYFNLDGSCIRWASDMMKVFNEVSKMKRADISSGKLNGALRIHPHDPRKADFQPPDGVESSDFIQIRFGKSKGGVHGVFYENVFYVIWFDPQHNMYPADGYQRKRIVKPPDTCCKIRDEELTKLTNEINKIKEDNKAFEELFEELAKE
ncbi:hypothetical protein [Acetobacterium wieringae]|uniref:hypothetical protein n=1 Tax=Acetobacterium wieringae TaxID=52694 RepID=UPI0031592D78